MPVRNPNIMARLNGNKIFGKIHQSKGYWQTLSYIVGGRRRRLPLGKNLEKIWGKFRKMRESLDRRKKLEFLKLFTVLGDRLMWGVMVLV